MPKPRLTFWHLWNMSFGFLGIQFGWGLQLANMSAIYSKLGAHPDEIPILWLAGPVTGLLVQPVVGSMSDRTWNRLGRRRPYFLVGAILVTGSDYPTHIRFLGAVALFASMTNIVSGFLITNRMLKMFKQPRDAGKR